ncbi:TetR/AcrR family transcriptional regulator [Prauserella halophila]|uniref:TetR/AcrR family transcriptional regulator n=1 Tax=Prauserella halophila TaxID=185641 RepID=A0ABP4GS87_9PSEU|nr:TetR/AcrR family transcriptional regulator [Prauserella halophila]MCP2236262.1 transcriptional regulator, TetR family [Prauserella halophila]
MERALPGVLSSGTGWPESLLERVFSEQAEPDAADDAATTRVLDAAYEQFCRTGIRRSTMDDVARRAGISRITVYRRFATKDALVEQVLRREFRRYFDRFRLDIRPARNAAERVELGFASALRSIRHHPLIGGLLDVEPDIVVPSLIGTDGKTMATVSRFVADRLRAEQRAGTVPGAVDVDLAAEMMVRVSASFLVTPSGLVDLDDDEQVRAVARRFLVPMLEPPATAEW